MIRFTDRILTVSDGAIAHHDGRIAGFASKIVQIPEHSAVLVLSGASILTRYLHFRMSHDILSFDDLARVLPGIAQHGMGQLPPGLAPGGKCMAALGGYSTLRGRFETYVISSHDEPALGAAAWTLANAPAYLLYPDISLELGAMIGVSGPPGSYEIDGEALAVRFVAAARHEASEEGGAVLAGRHWVGGFIEAVTTRRDESASQIVHRWPDRINEQINPNDGAPIPAMFADRPATYSIATENPDV
jgi:hypothetical protein